MKSVWVYAVVMIVVLIGGAVGSSGSMAADGLPESSLVIVTGSSYVGTLVNNGFVIGDGTLVVTCDHAVFETSKGGRHRAAVLVSVFSPYLGEACSARVLASDEELDLAVLEVPWKGHPALSLADSRAIASAQSACVTSLRSVIQHMEDQAGTDVETFAVDEEQLPVAFIAVRGQEPQFVTLGAIGQLGPGWSGSPILVPGTDSAIGCFASITRTGEESGVLRHEAKGAAATRVPWLLGNDFDQNRLLRVDVPLQSPSDAHEACSLALRIRRSVRPGRHESSEEMIRTFLRLRPDSAYGHGMLAMVNKDLGRMDAARQSFKRTLELDPNNLNTQILYAQFLTEIGEPNEAQRILEPLWLLGESRTLAVVALVNLFSARKDFGRCLQILGETVRDDSRNAYLWQQMAATRMQLQGAQAAIEPIARAVKLCPERGPLRGGLAQLLEKTGAFDEAERHFRKLLEIEPENPVVHYWLADFLRKHRPQAGAEALEIAEKAVRLPPRGGLTTERIQELIQRLREQRQPAVQQ